ncbi:hypothetical protein CDAR_422451 [Caerostris darwini]|uniref:Uncharacterized protein n=1 Tax=Caerostris darwini TaxID=1538125 RepID=A0AAV4N4N6_9ARAC|nr:hypothetical protein CDAR_422451 [Caerostris darwini]
MQRLKCKLRNAIQLRFSCKLTNIQSQKWHKTNRSSYFSLEYYKRNNSSRKNFPRNPRKLQSDSSRVDARLSKSLPGICDSQCCEYSASYEWNGIQPTSSYKLTNA